MIGRTSFPDFIDDLEFRLDKNENPTSSNSEMSDSSLNIDSNALEAQQLLEHLSEGHNSDLFDTLFSDLNVDSNFDGSADEMNKKVTKRIHRKRKNTNESNDPVLERNRKNAILARENRQKKKKYVEGLEKENSELKDENSILKDKNRQSDELISNLKEEITYLKSILVNQSTLSKLLQNIGSIDQINLTTSFAIKKKHFSDSTLSESSKKYSGGVCLHVAHKNVSLEFCSQCASQAVTDVNSDNE